MSLVKEGTTALGYRCDAKGCASKATHTPMICIPYEGWPVEIQAPIMMFIFNQICGDHRKDVRESEMLGPKMRRKATEIAARSGGKPAFDRAYVMFFPCISPEYQDFVENMGLVPKDDAKAKGTLILPEGF